MFNPMLLGHIIQLVFCKLDFMLTFVCARVYVRMLVRARVRARACVRAYVRTCVRVYFYVDVHSYAVTRGFAASVGLSWFNAFFREVLPCSYLTSGQCG